MWVPVAVWQPCELLYTCYLLTRRRTRVQIAVATLSGNSLRQTVQTHCASVHQAAKLVAALFRVAGVTAGLAKINSSLSSGLWLTSSAGWLPRTGISSGTLSSVIEYGLALPFLLLRYRVARPTTCSCHVPTPGLAQWGRTKLLTSITNISRKHSFNGE